MHKEDMIRVEAVKMEQQYFTDSINNANKDIEKTTEKASMS